MTDQYSLFPTYLKELQTEAEEKKRKRLEELQQIDFLKSFEKEWIEGFAEVEAILNYLEKNPATVNILRGKKLHTSEDLLKIQKDWISLCGKYTGMEKDFFKPYWVPICSTSLDFFIDLSDKNMPVIESVFYFIEPMQYMKIVLTDNASDLIKHNVKAKSWFVISYQEKMRQQKLITSQRTGKK